MRKEEVIEKATELGQKYFPDECNVWARANTEAAFVRSACIEMSEWMQKKMIEKACEYAQSKYDLDYCGDVRDVLNYLKSLVEE